MRPFACLVSLVFLAPAAQAWEPCAHREPRTLDLAAEGVRTLVVRAKAGSLAVRGGPGQSVAARGESCSSDAEALPAIRLLQQRSGDTLTLTVEMPEVDSDRGNRQRSLDLVVDAPARLALVVQDSSGETEIRGLASVSAEDSSGDIGIESIAGDVTVRDSSGSIEVRTVGGRVLIPADSSGDITVRDVRGDVEIEQDSSGGIALTDIGGNARVARDSSGEIEFLRLTGGAEVGSDSSGGIDAREIGRDFIVRHDGSGGISHDGVRGRVDVPDEH